MLTFLHISDIHFRQKKQGTDTVAARYRELLVDDIRAVTSDLGPMDAVLLVGDVANTGKPAEYAVAAEFLNEVTELIGCPPEAVCCVPGNHDVDRGAHDIAHNALRQHLRDLPPNEATHQLFATLQQEQGSRVLLSSLNNYSEFALRYGCALTREELVWGAKTFRLDDRSVLVQGLTSAWVCDGTEKSHDADLGVLVGEFQGTVIKPDPDTIAIAMVHHPGHWVRDDYRVRRWLNRAQIVLTGHEHAAGIDTSDPRRVMIASGAVNPDTTDDVSVPSYNVIQLSLPDESHLEVRIYPRCVQEHVVEFGRDPRFDYPTVASVELGAAAGAGSKTTPASVLPLEPGPEPEGVEVPEPEPMISLDRELIYAIMSAPADDRHRAARKIGLTDVVLGGLSLDAEIINRAREMNMLAKLNEEIANG